MWSRGAGILCIEECVVKNLRQKSGEMFGGKCGNPVFPTGRSSPEPAKVRQLLPNLRICGGGHSTRVHLLHTPDPRPLRIHSTRDQSIGSPPPATKKAFAVVNGRLPKKPRRADKGDGCGLRITKCLSGICPSTRSADAPHPINTTPPCRAFTASRIAAVTRSHPSPRCELAACARTVSTEFSNKTP